MHEVSPKTRKLIDELFRESKSFINKIFFNADRLFQIVDDIGSCSESVAIVHLAPLLYSSSNKLSYKIAEAISKLLSSISQKDFVILDEKLRGSYYNPYLNLKLSEISAFKDFKDFAWVPLCIASASGNGFIRERCLRLLYNLDEPQIIPFLLLRTNDWVAQVRDVAAEATKQLLTGKNAEFIINNLYLISRLEGGRAKDYTGIKKYSFEVLMQVENREALLRALSSADLFIRRCCYPLALNINEIDKISLIHRGLTDRDILIKLTCIEALSKLSKQNVSMELIKSGLCDPFMHIRNESLKLLLEYDYQIIKEPLHNLLHDSSLTIRQASRNAIKRFDPNVVENYFISHYKHLLLTVSIPSILTGAIAGLSEVGDKTNCNQLLPFLVHRSAKIRKAALKGIFILNAGDYIDIFYKHLTEDSPGVSKHAALLISKLKPFPSISRLLHLFNQVESESIKLNILSLINKLPKWERITALLSFLKETSPEVSEQIKLYLKTWVVNFNKGETSSDKATLKKAESAFNHTRHLLDPSFASQLEFYLK